MRVFHRLEKVAFEVLGSRQEPKEIDLQSINPKIRIRTHLAPEKQTDELYRNGGGEEETRWRHSCVFVLSLALRSTAAALMVNDIHSRSLQSQCDSVSCGISIMVEIFARNSNP